LRSRLGFKASYNFAQETQRVNEPASNAVTLFAQMISWGPWLSPRCYVSAVTSRS